MKKINEERKRKEKERKREVERERKREKERAREREGVSRGRKREALFFLSRGETPRTPRGRPGWQAAGKAQGQSCAKPGSGKTVTKKL